MKTMQAVGTKYYEVYDKEAYSVDSSHFANRYLRPI